MVLPMIGLQSIVDCRIGSLEKDIPDAVNENPVDCRIGSLEIAAFGVASSTSVDCRIGSLENTRKTES